MAYFNKKRYATDDAMRIGRLHTHLPGWTEANVAFMQVGSSRRWLRSVAAVAGCRLSMPPSRNSGPLLPFTFPYINPAHLPTCSRAGTP